MFHWDMFFRELCWKGWTTEIADLALAGTRYVVRASDRVPFIMIYARVKNNEYTHHRLFPVRSEVFHRARLDTTGSSHVLQTAAKRFEQVGNRKVREVSVLYTDKRLLIARQSL